VHGRITGFAESLLYRAMAGCLEKWNVLLIVADLGAHTGWTLRWVAGYWTRRNELSARAPVFQYRKKVREDDDGAKLTSCL